MTNSNTQPNSVHLDPPASGPDSQVRAGSPDSAHREPAFAPNPERREGVSSRNPSTGPVTPEGKAISSRNAVTHGLRATKLENAVAPAMRVEYEKLRRQYLDDYKPAGAIESTLVDLVIFAAWQLYKIRDMELFTDLDLGMPGSFGRSEKLARYRGSQERLFFRSLNQLKQIQQERAFRETSRNAAIPAHLPPAVRTKPLHDHLKHLARHPRTLSASTSIKPRPAIAPRGPRFPAQSPARIRLSPVKS